MTDQVKATGKAKDDREGVLGSGRVSREETISVGSLSASLLLKVFFLGCSAQKCSCLIWRKKSLK